MSKVSYFTGCQKAICPNSAPPLRSSTYKLLDRPHLHNTVDIQVTPLEMTILIASLVVFLLMFIWILLLMLSIGIQYARGTLFSGEYTTIEGRRYRQYMMRGGDHLEHRLIRRSIVEKLARFGVVTGGVVLPKVQKIDDVEATGIAEARVIGVGGAARCDGQCLNGIITRRRSAEQ